VLPPEADSTVALMQVTEKPDVTYADIGGMDVQKQEIREAVELPLTHGYLYQRIGIDPPRGVLMYGPPGMFYQSLFWALLSIFLVFFLFRLFPISLTPLFSLHFSLLCPSFPQLSLSSPLLRPLYFNRYWENHDGESCRTSFLCFFYSRCWV
jgi:hypothetical protein